MPGYKKRSLALSGSVTSAVDIVPSVLAEDFATFSVHLTGTWVGTVQWQGSNDGTNWTAIRAQDMGNATLILGAASTNSIYRGSLGVRYFRVTCTAYTSGTVAAAVLLHPEHMATIVKST